MSNLSVTENWADGSILTSAILAAAMTSIETWANGNVDSSNIAASGVTESCLAAASVTETKIGSSAVTTTKIADSNITLAKFAAEVTKCLVPTGAVLSFAGTVAPTGFLMCDGSAVSRTTYSSLYSILGNHHGSGDGSTTFNLPDYRGRFLRGVDGGAGNDPDTSSRTAMNSGGNTGDAVGSVQNDAFQGHHHTINLFSGGTTATEITYAQPGSSIQGTVATADPISDGANGTPLTASETRPRNAYVYFIIKT